MIFCLFFTINAGLFIDADAPCNLVQVRHVLQLDDRYFILDKGDYQVKVTDARGALHYRFGRKGEGPGEFQYPSTMGVVRGEIWIHDQIKSHVQRFTTEGLYLGVHKLAAMGPIQFESKRLVLHTPTQTHMFTVFDEQFEELGQVGAGMDAIGGVNVDQIVHYLQVYALDDAGETLFSIGVNGKTITCYNLKTMALQYKRDLPLERYAAAQQVQVTESSARVQGGRPVKSAVFYKGFLFALVEDENQEEHCRLVVFDSQGTMVQNDKLETYYTRIIGNAGHDSAFFINGEESLIEERPLALPQ